MPSFSTNDAHQLTSQYYRGTWADELEYKRMSEPRNTTFKASLPHKSKNTTVQIVRMIQR